MSVRGEVLCRASSFGVLTLLLLGVVGVEVWTLAVVAAYGALQVSDARRVRRTTATRVTLSPLRVALPVVRVRRRRDR